MQEPYLENYPKQTWDLKRLEVSVMDFALSFQSLMAAVKSEQKMDEDRGGRTPRMDIQCLAEQSTRIDGLINGGCLEGLAGVVEERDVRNSIDRAISLAQIMEDKIGGNSEELECSMSTLGKMLELHSNLEIALRVMAGLHHGKS